KGKSQTVTLTLPKSQGPEVPGALSMKCKRPKSKKPPTETKVTPPKPTKGSDQSHSVSSGTVPDPHDLERNIQLASMGLPSTPDEGTRKSQPLPKSTATHPKDSGGNIQPLDSNLTSMTSDEGTAKTTSRLEGSFRDKDSGETNHSLIWNQSTLLLLIFQALVLSTRCEIFLLSDDEAQEIEEDILGEKHEEARVNYADLKASINEYYDENIAHRDQTDKLVEASMSSLDKSSNTISDLYKGLNIITKLLKEIKNAVEDDFVINKKISEATESFNKFSTYITNLQSSVNTLQAHALKQDEEIAAWAKSSTNMAWNLGSRLSTNVEGENATNTATEEPPSHTEGETDDLKLAIPISLIQPTEVSSTQAQPITTITTYPKSSQVAPRIDKGKGIANESE
ncbi:hypothetical protein Tco_0897021, partial [Tanacetum coccineum]